MMPNLTVVFPCAGKAERFGNTFKPFLKIGDLTFIEKAYEPFKRWSHAIDSVQFIITKQQELEHNVVENMHALFPEVPIKISILNKETSGPVQTFLNGYVSNNDSNSSFIVCDCDHSINVDNLFEDILNNPDADIIIPTWDIHENIEHNWSKILLNDNKIQKFVNKEKVDFFRYTVKGIIGCIYFSSSLPFVSMDTSYRNFYEVISSEFTKNKKIVLSETSNAYFFGDPQMLQDCINKRRRECTIFCDIDGVLLRHNDHSTNNVKDNICLDGSELLKKLKNDNHYIVLTTARSKKHQAGLEVLLTEKDIYYDELVTGLPSGPRVLINDHKPSKVFTSQASSYEVKRNKGLAGFEIEKIVSKNDTKIIKDLSANSFAKTYLIDHHGQQIVRKQIEKDVGLKHVNVLKRQVADLARFRFLNSSLCPKVYTEYEDNYQYYYDMEYLFGFKPLAEIESEESQELGLKTVLDLLKRDVYSLSKNVDRDEWMREFLEEKIYPKFTAFCNLSKEFETIINSKHIIINDEKYLGLREALKAALSKNKLGPEVISVVHGDLTLENIMYNESNLSVKLIDMDGSRLFDARELDLGKLSQSIFSRYGEWKTLASDQLVSGSDLVNKSFETDNSYFHIPDTKMAKALLSEWQQILNVEEEEVFKKCCFYMSTYFIRFVPFRMQISKEHGIYALLMGVAWLNKLT